MKNLTEAQKLRNTIAWALGYPGEETVETVAKHIELTGDCVWHAVYTLGITKQCGCAGCRPVTAKRAGIAHKMVRRSAS